MPGDYSSKMALQVEGRVALLDLLEAARGSGDVQHVMPRGGKGAQAAEVTWGGRTDRGLVSYSAEAGEVTTQLDVTRMSLEEGIERQALLLQACERHLPAGSVTGVRDHSAQKDLPIAFVHRAAAGRIDAADVTPITIEGTGVSWLRTDGVARFGVPDLELYDLPAHKAEAASTFIRAVLDQLLTPARLKADLRHPNSGKELRLVPLLQAWPDFDRTLPGVGRKGTSRGEHLEGPRATVAFAERQGLLRRMRPDYAGVIESLAQPMSRTN